jgi:hypothetical protein
MQLNEGETVVGMTVLPPELSTAADSSDGSEDEVEDEDDDGVADVVASGDHKDPMDLAPWVLFVSKKVPSSSPLQQTFYMLLLYRSLQ